MRRRREHRPPPEAARRARRWRRNDVPAGADDGAPENDGSTGEQERLILDALADLRDMDVREVMTPRVDVVPLVIPVHADDVARAVRESGHSCFPVVGEDLDDLVGVLFVNDLFRTGRPRGSESLPDATPLDISRRVRSAYVVPETLGVLEALADMRRQRRGFAVVVDEYGGVAGVLTVKDLIEPLVGDLRDEFDAEEEAAIVRVDRNRWLLDGRASVDEVRERLGIEIPDGEYLTLGGLMFDGLDHIPEEGESLPLGEWELKVVEMDKRRVAKVLARHGPRRGGVDEALPPGVPSPAQRDDGGGAERSEPGAGSDPQGDARSERGGPDSGGRSSANGTGPGGPVDSRQIAREG